MCDRTSLTFPDIISLRDTGTIRDDYAGTVYRGGCVNAGAGEPLMGALNKNIHWRRRGRHAVGAAYSFMELNCKRNATLPFCWLGSINFIRIVSPRPPPFSRRHTSYDRWKKNLSWKKNFSLKRSNPILERSYDLRMNITPHRLILVFNKTQRKKKCYTAGFKETLQSSNICTIFENKRSFVF